LVWRRKDKRGENERGSKRKKEKKEENKNLLI
jgi:hypothetical protein